MSCLDYKWLDNKTRKVKVEVDLYVNWGELPGKTTEAVSSASADLRISGLAAVDFQPVITARADRSGVRLESAVVRIDGPLAFTADLRLEASANGHHHFSQTLLEKRFVKVIWAGQIPIVINGRLQVDGQFRAEAEANLDVRKTLTLGYDLTAGVEYDGNDWIILREATPWKAYELRGEADSRAFVEARFIPELELKFYDVAGGRILVEPYLYGEAALEGHFVYQGGTGGQGSDADYRFTELTFGGGIDAGFRLGLDVFGRQLAGYPSRDPDELHRFALIEDTPILGLPTLAPGATDKWLLVDGRCALGLDATITPVPNPFQALTGGESTFNAFVEDSAAWQLVLPDADVRVTPSTEPTQAWLSADQAGRYTLRFSGHSDLGSFIRQYEEVSIDYDPNIDDCPSAGRPWMQPASGSWLAAPEPLRIGADSAEMLYVRMVDTYDGTTPADPSPPTPNDHDEALSGPLATFDYDNQRPSTLKRSKLRVVGCTAGSCGPASEVYQYQIDRRGGDQIGVAPASGHWTSAPQHIAVSSAGARDIYFRVLNTYDGSTPADPSAPSPLSFDDVLQGPEATFTYDGRPGQLKRSKLRFVGCSDGSCGPVSEVFEYSLDQRSGSVGATSYPLNDTGIDWCADGNSNFLECPVAGYPGQDAEFGRDVAHNDPSDGHAGFSFTKLDADGRDLPASATRWSCVRDNVTGLIWEVKTDDGGLHDKDDSYSWYNTDPSTNGGFEGYADEDGDICAGYDSADPASYCNTQAFVERVNQRGLCGAQNWRLPSIHEMLSIISNDRTEPAIDVDYFPNRGMMWSWSSSTDANASHSAWGVHRNGDTFSGAGKRSRAQVRLVCAGQ